ncbi:oligosaccharide flippase family protein [Solwaraspora sp. WMMD791]|uniref:lipopolysaccharide biosynthesis protein n=1 Tax=Solwaraspora sp. WMMD791 TaxID=3016086 RepID=UPI00249A7B5E|nr:oligosaccharide flippase family protein [Solwaraspora sp. WMMD791]WFE28153.1 oligosaccharide flippase family protein [Solwaraspora sp. WMMD791]
MTTTAPGRPTAGPVAAPDRPPGPAGPGRDRAVGIGIVTAMAARGVGMAAPLVITPICFRYLGDQRYGLWMAVTALTGMAWFADLGLGNGLLTRLSHLGADVRQQAREISSAFATVGALALALLGGLAVVVGLVPWDRLFGVTDPAVAAEAAAVVLLCFAAFAINIPFALVQRVQYAAGQVAQSSAWQSAGSLASMVAVLVAVAAGWPPVTVIACAVFAVPAVNLLNTMVYFGVQRPATRPAPRLVHRTTAAGLLRLGLRFFVLTTISSIALNVDSPLVANVLGLTVAAHYAVVAKLFGVLSVFVGIVGMTVWPVNGAALSNGEVAWVRRHTRRMVLLYGTVVGGAGLALVGWGHRVADLWVGGVDRTIVPVTVLAALACWSFVVAVTSPLMLVQNSVGLLRPQFAGWAAFLLLATGLKVWGVHRFGLVAVPMAACVAYLVTLCPAAVVGYRRALTAAVGVGCRTTAVDEEEPDVRVRG